MATETKEFQQTKVVIHQSADIFPMLEGRELQELSDSIKKHGLRDKLKFTREGVLVDGRNRLAAMTLAKIQLKPEHIDVIDFDDEKIKYSIDEYIVMSNIERRNLTRAQRRELAGKLAHRLEEAQAEKPKEERVDTTAKAAEAAGVSRRTAASAKQEALVNMGLREAPTPQNPSKHDPTIKGGSKKATKPDQAPPRPPAVVKMLTTAGDAIKQTSQKWPEERQKQAVLIALTILKAFGTTTIKLKDDPGTDWLRGAWGLPRRDNDPKKLEVVKDDTGDKKASDGEPAA